MKRILVLGVFVLVLVHAPIRSGEKASDALRKQGADSVSKAEFVVFNTVETDGFPQTRAMANLHAGGKLPVVRNGGVVLYFATLEGTNKIRQLRANPKASAYYLDAKAMVSALYTGEAEEVKDIAVKKEIWVDWMKGIYKSPDNPDFVLIRLVPIRVKIDAKGKAEQGDL